MASAPSPAVAIGVDVGGTFTDCILIRDGGGGIELTKVPSRADAPNAAVMEGFFRLLRDGEVAPGAVDHFGHGTTVATNTVIEESGARVGVLVTAGFRDALFLRRVRFPRPANMNGPLPTQLLPRRHVIEVTERVDVDGNVLAPIDLQAAVAAGRRLVEDEGISAIAVCFLHAYRNPAHEMAVKEALQTAFPEIFVTVSSEVSPRPREYERFMTTVMNAYVGERMRRYLTALECETRQSGVAARTLVTKSDGGILNTETAGAYPVQTMLSGPAAGVVGAYYCARAAGLEKIITWDMGGTSLDVAVIDGRIRYTEEASIGEHALFIPTVDVISIGAGGGSIAWIDAVGMLHVGPRSAGANPGPACYGRGGAEPTLTDAYVALGIIHPARFANGEMTLDRQRSLDALERLGERLELDALSTAEAMLEIATAQIQTKCMPLLARYGIDPEEYALLPYGGAGPTHAFLYAKSVGIRRLIVPLFPGLLCALGTIIADLRFDVPSRVEMKLDAMDEDDFNRDLDDLGAQALDRLRAQRVHVLRTEVVRSAFMRYVGQSFDLEITLPPGRVTRETARAAFLAGYRARYGYCDERARVEIVSVVAHAIGETPKPALIHGLTATEGTRERYERQIYSEGRWIKATALARKGLRPGDRFQAPVLIDQADTTTYVPAGFTITIDDNLNILGELVDGAH
jgi:N-methylhydantoinase A